MTTQNPPAASQQAAVDAALLLLERMGLSLDDLTAAPRQRPSVPTFADYVPVVSAAVTDGTRKAYGSYWNRVTERWGTRRLDEPTPSEVRQLVKYVRSHVDFMTGMHAAWQQVDHLWDGMVTECRLLPTPAMTDASDLVLRLGRPVWDNPRWMPAHAQRAPRRPPSVLAPGAADFKAVVAAAHQAIDALALIAKADGQAVESAAAAGRLYVPTRSLPGEYDVPRPFAPAPVTRCRALHEAYGVALDATIMASRALDELSLAAGTPSKVLALARAEHRPRSISAAARTGPMTTFLPFGCLLRKDVHGRPGWPCGTGDQGSRYF
jgi:hypothetical protein